jgi:uncharacterized membrane protein HdeD (DUF308 family)
MGIGAGIFLLVVGGILAFGVSDAIEGVNLYVIGLICMAAGVLGIVLGLFLNSQRANTSHRVVEERRDVGGTPPPR